MQPHRNPIFQTKVCDKAASAGAIDASGMCLVNYDVPVMVGQEGLDDLEAGRFEDIADLGAWFDTLEAEVDSAARETLGT